MKPFYYKLRLGLYLLAILCAVGSLFLYDYTWYLLIAAGLLLIAGYVITLKFCRCPHCNHVLPSQMKMPESCPYCKANLSEKHL